MQSSITVPDNVKKQFPQLVELILASESMNDEERQYWINILPIMTPEQIQNLQDILDNEQKQLKAIDEKYAKQIEQIGNEELVKKTGSERRARRQARQESEEQSGQEEDAAMEDVLDQIENL